MTQLDDLKLQIYDDPSVIAGAWMTLEATALGTVFQSYGWVSSWCRTAAGPMGEEPVIACWSDQNGPAIIWPMALTRWGGFRILTWLGQGYTNYNMGLYRDGIAGSIDAARLYMMETELARLVPRAVAFHLIDQPVVWNGFPNPHALLPHDPSANISYEMPLQVEPEALFRSALSKDTRRRLERLERRLNERAEVEYGWAQTHEQRLQNLSVFLRQKSTQFEDLGVADVFAHSAIQNFYSELYTEASGLPFESAYLKIGQEIVATSNGIQFQDRFYHLTLSMKLEHDQTHSPGRLLARHHIAHQCRTGTKNFDFGPGAGRHKLAWHPRAIAYFESYRSLGKRGMGVTILRRLIGNGRRRVWTAPWMQNELAKVRRAGARWSKRR